MNFIKNINWKHLRKQKKTLINLILSKENTLTEEQKEHLQGIVNLLDSIQDYAVDTLGIEEKTVFNLK